jgi:hypothetical protein
MEMVKFDLLVLFVDLLLLVYYDVALALDCAAFELGVLEDVRDDVDGLRDILAEALGIVDGLLGRGVHVEVGTEVLHFEFECMLGMTAGALEGHLRVPVAISVNGLCETAVASECRCLQMTSKSYFIC